MSDFTLFLALAALLLCVVTTASAIVWSARKRHFSDFQRRHDAMRARMERDG